MRMLQLSPENRLEAQRVVNYASKPEHYYSPPTDWCPGDQPEYTCRIDSFRCVFTITDDKEHGKILRHLSISIPNPNAQPNQFAVYTLATWFGFTGAQMQEDVAVAPGKDWQVGLHETEHCIVLAQLLPKMVAFTD